MNNSNVVLLITLYLLSVGSSINAACTISTNQDITNPQVLILRWGGGVGNDAFFMPDVGGDIINIPTGQVVHLNCGGRNFRINGVNVGVQSANATCSTGSLFNVQGSNVQFSTISCSLYPVHSARFTGNTCLGTYQEFKIGYDVNGRFIEIMTGCFDQYLQNTLYTLMELIPNVEGRQIGFPRPAWTEGSFYNLGGVSLDTLYTRNQQRITINNLLGLEASSGKYVHATNNFYLARGHLAANADYVFGTQQRATFYLTNAAPQWQMVNQANWATLEANIRNQVINRSQTFWLYTGTYGISTLPHEQSGREVELFLHVDQNNNRAIPVPQLFWKAAYEPVSRAGVVFLTLNNPYLSSSSVNSQVICPDVCNQISWLTWTPTNITRGYSYCCTVDSFRSATGFLPNLVVSSLLT